MTFIPGGEPGDYALGVPHPEDPGRLAAYKLKMARMPTGANVAEKFPWLRKVHETLVAGEHLVILRPGWQATFENNSDHKVDVDEIRFFTSWGRAPDPQYQTQVLCKIGIPPRREVIADWMPVQTLHTEHDRMFSADIDTFSYELPAPYVLQRGNQFVMDWHYNVAMLTNMNPEDWVIMCGLHGYGLQDHEPISLMKAIRGWPQPAGQANQWQTITFDEEQGRPMRDAVITHISFGSAMTTNVGPANVLEALEFRPHAPEGPVWHQSEFFCIRDVAEQVGRWGTLDYWCIHRPIVPYVLDKGEGIMVELWNDAPNPVTIDVILRGSQTGRR
jgi:hypothetical protein